MEFSTQQISPEKWGIYDGDRLLATVGCQATCKTFMANLASGRRDAPEEDVDALYQAPKLRKEIAAQQPTASTAEAIPQLTVESLLEAGLSTQDITVSELESAVLKAQSNQLSASNRRSSQKVRKNDKRTLSKASVRSAS